MITKTTALMMRHRRSLLRPSVPAVLSGPVAVFESAALQPLEILAQIGPTQPGSGDPSPSNIRPIKSHTGLTVYRAGKNLSNVGGFTYPADGSVCIIYNGLPPGRTYTVSYYRESVTTTGNGIRIRVQYVQGGSTRTLYSAYAADAGWASYTAEIPEDAENVEVRIYRAGACSAYTVSQIQLEIGDTRTEYEPYHAFDAYPVTWTEAGTVYAGTLDLTTGELVVTHAGLVLTETSGTWARQSANNPNGTVFRITRSTLDVNPDFPDTSTAAGWSEFDAVCSHFVKSTARAVTTFDAGSFFVNASYLYFVYGDPNQGTTLAEWKNFLTAQETAGTPLTFVGELASPLTYQLTPVQVAALIGENNVWSDAGDTEVTHRRYAWQE